MVNKRNVTRLVQAAWHGMEVELAKENSSAEDVINATIAIAAGGINYACSMAAGADPEAVAHNRQAIRAALQQLLLNTSDNDTVQ